MNVLCTHGIKLRKWRPLKLPRLGRNVQIVLQVALQHWHIPALLALRELPQRG